ncbi:MAG: carboxypeptidase regulatory-like domain-containing protein, partial [Deltaproteobacteria bacterium]|nr:carboxypeptidase regulatory-like domain-containing protein [Nannocystaceae bacterium]
AKPSTPTSDVAPAPAPSKAAEALADVAIFMVRDKGMVMLGADGFSTLPGTDTQFIQRISRGADGKLRALGSSEIWTVDAAGLTAETATSYDDVGSLSSFDVDRKGVVWTIGSKGVGHREGSVWTHEPVTTFGKGQVLLTGIAVDGDDRPWVSTGDAIFHDDGSGWKAAAMPGGPRFLDDAVRGPDGAVYVTEMGAVFRGSKGAVARYKVPKTAYGSLGEIAFSDAGIGAIRNDLEGAAVFLPADASARYRGPKDFAIGSITALAVDDRQRVWIAGEGGSAIVGPEGLRTVWRSGSMEPIAGQVSQMIVLGKGPELPAAGAVKVSRISGRIVDGEKGLAKISVELCESPSMIYSRTPCTGAPTHLRATTDADGRFSLDGVPLGAYGVAVKIGRKWQTTMGTALGSKMRAGEPFDIGEIAIASK